ncbi:MAG: class I SAM-dependent methyltransferase [Pseudomonadota bacterium]
MKKKYSDIIGEHYEKHAHDWDRDRQRSTWIERPWIDRFVEKLSAGATVLDLGCGSGRPIAQYMADHNIRITGIDASQSMIKLCRDRLPGHDWIAADMRGLHLERQFNGILAWDSFFHLKDTDQRKMFAVFARHACEGSLLMFNTGTEHTERIGEYRGDPLFHSSLAQYEYWSLAEASGFDVVQYATNETTAGGRTVWPCQQRDRS